MTAEVADKPGIFEAFPNHTDNANQEPARVSVLAFVESEVFADKWGCAGSRRTIAAYCLQIVRGVCFNDVMALEKAVDPQVLARVQTQARELSEKYVRQNPNTLLTKTREESLRLLESWVASEALRKHMLAVEAAMVAYARKLGADEALWGATGLLRG